MGRKEYLLFLVLIGFACIFIALSLSPLSTYEQASEQSDLPDWIDDVYLNFDTLKTDMADYHWPTEATRTMSSAFGEFRRTHFHAGIDISTRGRTGYRVFASRSGYIARIFVSPFGYGRMLQIRHRDGFTTVYAHLSKFKDEIEDYVRRLQYAREQYSLDLRPEPELFPVVQGDVIAYTGDTGAGPPHLHFEIRDENMNPANPLLFPEFIASIVDTRNPVFQKVTFAPFDHAGRIYGAAVPLTLSARNTGGNSYTLPGVIRLSGAVGLSVRAVDRVNATWHNNGVYHYELYLDSMLLYTSKLDRFSSRQTEQIALHYDWPLVEAGEGRFQKLFLEPGNRLPLYARYPERSGVIEPGAHEHGPHTLTIIARDPHGNESTLTARIILDELPQIDVMRSDTAFVLVSSTPENVGSVTIASRLPGSSWIRKTYETGNLESIPGGLVLPVPSGDNRTVRIVAKSLNGTSSPPVFFCPPTQRRSNTSLSITREFVRDYLLVTLTSHLPFTHRPTLWIRHGTASSLVEINAVNERTYAGTFPLSEASATTLRLEAHGSVNGTPVRAYDEFSVFPILPGEGGSIVAGDGEFEVEFPAYGVYQPMYCRVEKTERGYAVYPQDVLLNLGATIRYRIPDGVTGAALFHSDEGDPSLNSARTSGNYFVGKVTKFLSSFSVEQDTVRPSITALSVRFTDGSLRFSFGLRDHLSGIDADKIRITVDERLIIAAYDSDKKRVLFNEPFRLDPGQHTLRVEAADKLGNRTAAARSFRSR
ncbi:MAG TPA: M23 family metallopeptidase [Bacteroidota bacterium]